MTDEVETEDWVALNAAALALYKLDHPDYEDDTFKGVPLLRTVTEYRHRAWTVWISLRESSVKSGVAVDRVLALHRAVPVQFEKYSVCSECITQEWPCSTIRALRPEGVSS